MIAIIVIFYLVGFILTYEGCKEARDESDHNSAQDILITFGIASLSWLAAWFFWPTKPFKWL